MTRKRVFLSFLLILQLSIFYSCKESEAQFAENLIEKFKEKSINKDKIDWKIFSDKVTERMKKSKELGIREALTLKNNPHSFYIYQGRILQGKYPSISPKDSCNLMSYLKLENFENIGYINVPKFYLIPNDLEQSKLNSIDYINRILDSIKSQDSSSRKAWVIDLRFNYGGDMWPMLIALSPFFNDGKLGSFKSNTINEIWKNPIIRYL